MQTSNTPAGGQSGTVAPGQMGGFAPCGPTEKRILPSYCGGAQEVSPWVHPTKGRARLVHYLDGNRLTHPHGTFAAESVEVEVAGRPLVCKGRTADDALRGLSGNLCALAVTYVRGDDGLTDYERARACEEARP